MFFERLLAKRYIFQQKRHSLLTVCSIIIAIGLMTSLMVSFDTLFKCLRNSEYSKNPYHLIIYNATEEQIGSMRYDSNVKELTLRENPNTHKQNVLIIFNKDIGDEYEFLNDFGSRHNISQSLSTGETEYNSALMLYDGIGDNAMKERTTIYCLFFVFVIFIVLALRLIIDTAFEVSSKERERQFGVLQSIGATPKQIVNIITWEGVMLCVAGIPIGLLFGCIMAFIAYKCVLTTGIADDYIANNPGAAEIIHFYITPLMLAISASAGVLWVMLSAYSTGMRIVKMSPLDAISNRSNTVKKVKKHSLFGIIFGWTGKLASRNSQRQRKRFIITVLSLTISITLFSTMSVVYDSIDDIVSQMFIDMGLGEMTSDLTVSLKHKSEGIEEYKAAYDKLLNCGYFSDILVTKRTNGSFTDNNNKVHSVEIYYCNKPEYAIMFKHHPPMPYEELTDNGYIMLNRTGNEKYENFKEPDSINELSGISSINAKMSRSVLISEEEYENLSDKEKRRARRIEQEDVSGDKYMFVKSISENVDFPIVKEAEIEGIYDYMAPDHIIILGTLDQYTSNDYKFIRGHLGYDDFNCVLKNPSYHNDALKYIDNNDELDILVDMFDMKQKTHSIIAAIKVGSVFFNIMIALISIVNMINIISTGIINRRSEIAAMECVGMSEDQLYRMTFIESLQYALTAAVSAVVLSALLLYGTGAFIASVGLSDYSGIAGGRYFSYSTILIRILLASVSALAVSFISSLIPLRNIQNRSLVEQIRSLE